MVLHYSSLICSGLVKWVLKRYQRKATRSSGGAARNNVPRTTNQKVTTKELLFHSKSDLKAARQEFKELKLSVASKANGTGSFHFSHALKYVDSKTYQNTLDNKNEFTTSTTKLLKSDLQAERLENKEAGIKQKAGLPVKDRWSSSS